MKIKLYKIQVLHAALTSLDGYDTSTKDSKAFHHYEYTAKVTWNRRKNLGILRRKIEDIDEERKAIAKKYSDGGEQVATDKVAVFQKEYLALLDQEEEVDGLIQFSEEDFNLYDSKLNPNGNKIAASTLDILEPLIKS